MGRCRLIPVTGLEDVDWEVFVVKDDTMKNAFVIPGGKVFVFTYTHPLVRSSFCVTDLSQWNPPDLW